MFTPTTNKQKFIYTLIYPALLGSMLFEILPIKFCPIYLFKILIVSFFLLDYYHLYFIMDNKFDENKKNSPEYIYSDLAVSFLLFTALKYADSIPILSIWAIVCVTICFLIYSNKLKYEHKFYKTLLAITFTFAVISTIIINSEILIKLHAYIYSIFLAIALSLYSKHIFTQEKLIKSTKK